MKRIKEPLKASILKQIITLLFRSVENGIENYAQIWLQCYLLVPYINHILNIPMSQVFHISLQNMIQSPISPCSREDAYICIGKLLLSIFSLSYGVSAHRTSKKGQTLGQCLSNKA